MLDFCGWAVLLWGLVTARIPDPYPCPEFRTYSVSGPRTLQYPDLCSPSSLNAPLSVDGTQKNEKPYFPLMFKGRGVVPGGPGRITGGHVRWVPWRNAPGEIPWSDLLGNPLGDPLSWVGGMRHEAS